MASSVMVSPNYNSDVYKQLGEVEAVSELVTKEQILSLGRIVLKYGLEGEVATTLAHNHFDLASNEAMLEVADDDGFIARPELLTRIAESGAKPNVLALCANSNVGDGTTHCWFPIQYTVGGQRDWENDAFLAECANHLVENDLADKLMLVARRPDANKGADSSYLETNWGDTRTSEIRPLPRSDAKLTNAIETTYTFEWAADGSGAIVPAMSCDRHCVSNGDNHITKHDNP